MALSLTALAAAGCCADTSNGAAKIGVGQGGAQASLFDNLAAIIVNQRGTTAPGASLSLSAHLH